MSEAAASVIVPAGPGDIETVRRLFLAYAESLGFSHCFRGFDKELAGLPGDYAPPGGALLLARLGGAVVGCVGVRRLDDARAEMKRLYLDPPARGRGLGRRLADAAIAAARAAGYRRLCLETLDGMAAARALYAELGFNEIPAYHTNSQAGMRCFELDLARPAAESRLAAAGQTR